jgi:hypothetical protein
MLQTWIRSWEIVVGNEPLQGRVMSCYKEPALSQNFIEVTERGIVSDYGLDGRGSIRDRGRGFFL